jgi:biotin carboxyl carrier protein
MVHKMPTYEVFVDGKPKKVELTKIGEKSFNVKMNGRAITVELPTEKVFDKGFLISVDDKKYHVELPKMAKEKLTQIKVEEATFKVEVKTPSKKPESTIFAPFPTAPTKAPVTTRQAVEGAVVAPMTGKILSIKVQKGELVKVGQILCILEAMKMENEVTAPKAGTVREIYVSEGSSVSEGEPLFIIN